MTRPPDPNRRIRPRLFAALAIAFGIGVAVAAYLDWYMWHPMSAIVTTLGLIVLLIAGGLTALVRSPRIRPIGLILLAVAIGGFVGQAVGPSRPVTHRTDTGSTRLVLTGPVASDAAGDATCGLVDDGSQILVDPGEFGLARASEDADFHYVSVAIGDMWDFGDPLARPDHISVTIRVIKAIVPEDGKPGETIHTTDRASTVTLGPTTLGGGSLTFANMVVEDPFAPFPNAPRSDFAGTISWTCGPIVNAPAA
jgi:hypothetical protein